MKVTIGDIIIQGLKETFEYGTFGHKFLVFVGAMILMSINSYLGYLFVERFFIDFVPIVYGIAWILFVMVLFILQNLVFNIGKNYLKFKDAGLMK